MSKQPDEVTMRASRVGWGERIGYAAGDTASCLYWQTFSLFLMIFYTDTYGLSPAAVGTLLLVTRLWDAAVDPLMGLVADRTVSRHGKFRPWILWGMVPLALTAVLMFVTPDFSERGRLVYAYITYTLVMMLYSLVNVPYGALLGVISPDSGERTTLASCRFIGAFVGNMLVQGLLLQLVKIFGKGNDKVGYPMAMIVLGLCFCALFGYTFVSTKERVRPPQASTHVRTDLGDLVKNRPWIVLCILGLFTLVYISVKSAATLYYFKYYIGDQEAVAPFLVVGTVFSMLGAIATPFITRRLGGKRRTFVVLTLTCAVCSLLFWFVRPTDTVGLYALNILQSVPNAALFPLIWAMYADTADYGEWKFGRRATGLVFSAGTFSQKMGWAVGGSFAALLLGWIQFVPNTQQTGESLAGIRHMMSTIPAVIAVCVAFLALLYNLDAKTELKMQTELARRKAEPAV